MSRMTPCVFISPTIDDLKPYREAAAKAARRAEFQVKMREGRPILLLDGLDEAPDESARKSASALFDKAVRDYGRCRFAVTTRPHSYTEKVRLPGFHHVQIAPLDESAMVDARRGTLSRTATRHPRA